MIKTVNVQQSSGLRLQKNLEILKSYKTSLLTIFIGGGALVTILMMIALVRKITTGRQYEVIE
jgi:hypothetical protein